MKDPFRKALLLPVYCYIIHVLGANYKHFSNYGISTFCIICELLLVGDHSKITLSTKNVFIECTATDLHKVKNAYMNVYVHDYIISVHLYIYTVVVFSAFII